MLYTLMRTFVFVNGKRKSEIFQDFHSSLKTVLNELKYLINFLHSGDILRTRF